MVSSNQMATPPTERQVPMIMSHVNAGVKFIDDLVSDDEREELIEQMNLHGNLIQSLDGLEAFSGLVELCLSSNYIEEIAFHALEPLQQLRVLDLSANSLSSTLGFPQLSRLEELSMAHNCLRQLEGLTHPLKFPKLRYFDLRGNELATIDDVRSLQRLKRLSHLRLQAANGTQANPICELDDYHHGILEILPKLELLDEEEVEFLREMGSLHMPKYRAILSRLEKGKQIERELVLRHPPNHRRPTNRSLKNQCETTRCRSPVPKLSWTRASSAENDRYGAHNAIKNQPQEELDATSAPPHSQAEKMAPFVPQERLVVKESSTNTEVDLEKDILRREQAVALKETQALEQEKTFLTKEKEFWNLETELKSQLASLQTQLEAAEARAIKAETTVLEMSTLLVQEKDQTAVPCADCNALQRLQREQQGEWDTTVGALKATHHDKVNDLLAANDALEKRIQLLQAEFAQNHQQVEDQLKQKAFALDESEKKAQELATELERERKAQAALVTRLSSDLDHSNDRIEHANERNVELERQVAQLKTNIESVYNKCIEKDEIIQQVQKTVAARQDEMETLRLQHVRETERQEKLLQQQRDLYERQLQASLLQVEMEFRQEHQHAAHKFQLLQRKHQERLKEMKRVRQAYQTSLQREASAKAEIEKLAAMVANDKKKLRVEDAKRSDMFQAKVREEKAQRKALEQQLIGEQQKYAHVAVLRAELDETKGEKEHLRMEIQRFKEAEETWKKLEDDLRAAIKVKDVMLADQLRQIKELTNAQEHLEAQFHEELTDYQTQIEDLEAALDESLEKVAQEEEKREAWRIQEAAWERSGAKKDEQLTCLRTELEQKGAALEFLDQEMQRMRKVLEKQDELFQKRLQKHLEQQQEQVERIRIGAEEERERQREAVERIRLSAKKEHERQLHEWETERSELMRKYDSLVVETDEGATKLRTALQQERQQTAQNDRDMRILLGQIDRERQLKKQHLRHIQALFEQLQREA